MRKIAAILMALVVFAVIAVAALPFIISGEALKEPLMTAIERSTGHKVNINGTLQVKIFPSVSVQVENVTVPGNDAAAGAAPLASLESMSVDVALLPLLNKQVIVQGLALKSPKIALRVSPSGEANWKPNLPGAVPGSETAESEKTEASSALLKNLRLDEMRITDGAVTYDNQATGARYDLQAVNLDVSQPGISEPFTAAGTVTWNGEPVKLRARIDTLDDMLSLRKAAVKAEVQSKHLAFDTEGNVETMNYRGKVHVSSPSLRDASAWATRGEPSSLPPLKLDLTGQALCGNNFCQFDETHFTLDDVKANGSVKLSYGAKTPLVELALNTDTLNLDPFLPEAAQGAGGSGGSTPATPGWSRETFDLSGLKAIDAKVAIEAGTVQARGVTMGKTSLKGQLEKGALALRLIADEFYGGKMDSTVNLNALDNTTLAFDKRATLQSVRMEPLLTALKATDRFSGIADFELRVSGRGANEYESVASLSGNGTFSCRDGAVKGLNIAEMARNVQSAFKNVDNTGGQKTDFSEVKGTFTISNGVVSNSDLTAKAPLLRVAGSGQVNLPNRTINYRLVPQIVETAQGQGGKDKEGLAVPIIISGTLDNPVYQPDVQGIARDVLQNPDKYRDQAREVMEGLGLRKKKPEPAPEAAPASGTATVPEAAPAAPPPAPQQKPKPGEVLKDLLKKI